MKHLTTRSIAPLLFLVLASSGEPAAGAEGPNWLSDVEAARARSRAEKKPLFAVFR